MITANDIVKANEVLKNVVERTPLDFDRYLSEKYGATIYIKKENMQKVRSFKLRGAYYAIHQLSDEDKEHGVVCASAGNHAQGVAYTCNEMKIPATIFMPVTTPLQKIGQVRFFGGKFVTIKLVGDTFDESAKAAQEYTKSEGMTFIDPFDDYNVQAGQGTVAYEIYEQAQEEGVSFDSILVPVGGGGLISGVATYIKDVAPSIEVVGVEASGARSMRAAFDHGYPVKLEKIDKFADGIAVQKVGAKTYEVARKYVDRLLGVDEGLISETLIDMYSKVGTIAEPAGAASVAALEVIKDEIKGKTIVCIISGGNNDINRMPEMEERALIYDGIKHYFVVNFPQRPGALREFVNDILGPNDDITRFEYIKRANKGKGPVLIGIALSDKNDYDGLLKRLSEFDPSYINLNGNETLYNMLV
ncbi:threonine ammonia-lyase IlvA [Streptococcus thermophilus]|uniref:threonine ammonia-lyase IlvA n=1 Tax=Streptococcus thermophilus TaxID=1308 RepID=UPI0022F00726|nr:threonine ammonia-lyase IlvA [Streptococcus thermophilus]MCE2065783.1 threonine ammonia-lyase IlvA [Streptococcus thermophilus]MCE2072199.1 threonine ammonia-lyase IlvA [Streptococcus thermophilus]MCE2077210.1 threonine ammonia-lyase IlvA [Streptococcus thermophilus]MCE2080617.1 threonine ammonia-lyase IlvA [Streptococcus thermophilus]MCE2081740.1 threonine ammonia-lyase IlvA [Streptococcus thermophilus]